MKHFNGKFGRLELELEWRLTLFTLVLVPVLASLGFWQLERADEKRELAFRHAERSALPPLTLSSLQQRLSEAGNNATLADRQLAFEAAFIAGQYLLLDNRIRDGRVGYELIALAKTESVWVPVNLGWIPGDPSRRSLPEVALPGAIQSLYGRVYQPVEEAYVLAKQPAPEQLPAVIQAFDGYDLSPALSRAVDAEVLPVEVRIDAGHPVARRADWPIVNQSPAKHTGYAVQWFTMSAVLLIAFIFRSSNLAAVIRCGLGRNSH